MEADEVALVGVGETSDGKGEASQRLNSVSDGAKFEGATVSRNGTTGLVDPSEDGQDN